MPFDGPSLRVRLFGVPSLKWDGTAIAFSTRPICAVLLAMILLAEPDRRLSRRTLAAELSPDDDEASAMANLRRYLSFLVTTYPRTADFIGRDREALWCVGSAAPWCDAVEFERGAFELYAADFMEGTDHQWVLAQRERLRSDAVDGLVRKAEALHDRDDDAGAIACARRASQLDPCNESVAQLEMTIHGECGDVAAMDAAFMALVRHLRDLDARPSPATVELADRFHRFARQAAAHIPRPMTSFVKTRALDDVAGLVPSHRLVTIVGPGGVGKTRLALEVAHKLAATFPDGVSFADLSTISEGDALSDALCRALGVPTDLASKGFAGVQTLLRNRRALLVLDNCEQIIESCSWFLSELFEAAPYVHVIATTREAFGLRAERCYAVQPLPPADAARLFVERARGVAWDASETATADRVDAVCKRLDHLPLALELAASVLGALPLADLERQLDDGFDLLRSRDLTTPQRHRSLSDVIAWSVSRLGEIERDAFVHLAVFAGSFSAHAAKGVCGVELSTLGALVAKSVLVRDDAVESRFVYSNTIGSYAARLFASDPRASDVRNAHAAWFESVAMRSGEPTFWHGEREWTRDVGRDFPNFAQALAWTLFEGGERRGGARLALGLSHYFVRCGFSADGIAWLSAAASCAEPGSAERELLALRIADFEVRRGLPNDAYERAHAARGALEHLGRERDVALALRTEATALLYLGREDEAKDLAERALPIARRAGDRHLEGWIQAHLAYILAGSDAAQSRERFLLALGCFTDLGCESDAANMLGSIAASDYVAERYDAANENLERALAIHRDFGDALHTAAIVSDLGDVALMRGMTSLARDYYREALAFCEDRDAELSYPTVFTGIAGVAIENGRARDAARLLGAARWHNDGTQTPARVRVLDMVRARTMGALGEDAYGLETRFGRELTRKEAARLAHAILER